MDLQQRHLAAILFTDVVGYTAIMQQDEKRAVATIKRHNSVLERIASAHHGQVVNYYGDGSLSIFQSATEAVQAAMELQSELQKDPIVPLRIGLHIGEIFFEDGKTLGDSVNLASRIQSLGQANTILFSGEIHNKIANHPEYKSVSLGLFDFKNVSKPIEVYALANEGLRVPKRAQMEGKLKHRANRLSPVKKSLLAIISVILLVASVYLFNRFAGKKKFTIKEKSIAVLPFQNMSGNKDNDWFSDGMTEEITTQLAKIADLKVISRTTAMTYRNSKKTTKEIAEELGVSSLLEGSVQRNGDETRITAQLIDGNTEQHIWAEHYDHKNLNDLFAMQSEVAQNIANKLNAHLAPDERNKIEKKPTNSLDAYNLYLKGRYSWYQRDGKSLRNGIDYFQQAIAIDPHFAKAWAGLADCYLALGYGGYELPKNIFPKAREAALKAIELDSLLADPHASLGYFKFYYDYDFTGSEIEYKKALSLNPNYENAYDWYGLYLTCTGRLADARQLIKKAQQINPLAAFISADLGFNLYYDKKFDEAIQSFKTTLKLNPTFIYSHVWLARSYQAKKMYKEAVEEYQIVLSNEPNFPVALAFMGNVYGVMGNKAEAEKILTRLNELSNRQYVFPYGIALVYAGLGNKDKTFEYLEKAYQDRNNWLMWLEMDPRWEFVRSDKRYAELVNKVGFPVSQSQ
ncbi:MAG: TPR end-of-group domain-containing protein [Chitinophagales bacterium]